MNVGLHARIVGRPGRARALARFLDHVAGRADVWVATRAEIARHWIAAHRPPDASALSPQNGSGASEWMTKSFTYVSSISQTSSTPAGK